MLKHDKEIAKPSRLHPRTTPYSEAAFSYGRGHGSVGAVHRRTMRVEKRCICAKNNN